MNTRYDVAIIGCGEAGIFAGYELMHRNPGLKVVTLDQGADIYTRSCPIVAGKVKECIHCTVCDTMCGFGGAGAFSDGKYNFTTAFGGWLTDFMPKREVMELIDYVDSINMKHGATTRCSPPRPPPPRHWRRRRWSTTCTCCRPSASIWAPRTTSRFSRASMRRCRARSSSGSAPPSPKLRTWGRRATASSPTRGTRWTVPGSSPDPGRSGAEWFSNQCKELGIHLINNQVDIGVRVELPAKVFEHITDVVYESKLVYRTKQYGDQVRTFCMNPYGHVVAENVEGINTVNGHSYSDPKLRSENTNFALLVSNRFTSPLTSPTATASTSPP